MKTTIAYILIALSILLSKAQFDGKIPLTFNMSLIVGKSAFVIPLLMQAFLLAGLTLLPSENGLKKVGKIIFILLSTGYLFTTFLFIKDNEYSYAKMYFLQFLISVLCSMYCVPLSQKIKNTTGLLLRILAVILFIYAVTVICFVTIAKGHFLKIEIIFIIILSAILLILWFLAQKLNPIESPRIKRKFYLSMLAFVVILFVWAKDITFQRSFDFRGRELSYPHVLFNYSFKRFFFSSVSSLYSNEGRKKIAIDAYMNARCEDYISAKNQNTNAESLKKFIVSVVQKDFNYFEFYKSATNLDSIDIDKVVENKNSIFNIFPYGDCGNE